MTALRNAQPTDADPGVGQRTVVVIFTRLPSNEHKGLAPGRIARHLSTALVLNTFATVSRASAPFDVVLATDGTPPPALRRGLDLLESDGRQTRLIRQHGLTFGERFLGALRDAADLGYDRIVAVGTDTPTMRPTDLDEAVGSPGVVLGPSQDGGFYLVGLETCELTYLEDLPWQQDTLLRTLQNRLLLGKSTAVVLATRADVDAASDARARWAMLCRVAVETTGQTLGASPATTSFDTTHATPVELSLFENPPLRGPPPTR